MDRKQSNKPFKGKSKGKVKGGRVERGGNRSALKNASVSNREERRNASRMRQLKSREKAMAEKKGEIVGGGHVAPKLVAVIGLTPNTNPFDICRVINDAESGNLAPPTNPEPLPSFPKTVRIAKWKSRLTVVPLDCHHMNEALEMTKVADLIIFTVDAQHDIDGESVASELISAIKAQGMPSVLVAITGMSGIMGAQKLKQEAKKTILERSNFLFTDEAKVLALDPTNLQERTLFIRQVCHQKGRQIAWKEARCNIFADHLDFEPGTIEKVAEEEGRGKVSLSSYSLQGKGKTEKGTLMISGFVRERGLAPNRLIHLSDYGCFKVKKVVVVEDPVPLVVRKGKGKSKEEEAEKVVGPQEGKGDDLDMLHEDVGMAMMDSLVSRQALIEKAKAVGEMKKVPKGTSTYQAHWITDEIAEGDNEDDEDEEDEQMGEQAEEEEEEEEEMGDDGEVEEEEEEHEWIELTNELGKAEQEDKEIEMEAEEFAEQLKQREKDEVDDFEFPDEVEAPEEETATDRFIKYRGLKSFRQSPWDPKELLPADYSNIYQFTNFQRVKKRVKQEGSVDWEGSNNLVPVGAYVKIFIEGVPTDFISNALYQEQEMGWVGGEGNERIKQKPILCFGMLKYENKMSVVHMSIKRHHNYTEPLPSKELLECHVGPRRFFCRPVFSEDSFNADKFKYERFLHERNAVASIYGPVTFPPGPVLWFRHEPENPSLPPSDDNKIVKRLVATGALQSVNPDRIILKRITLTGHPFKVHKKRAVVRNMFYFPDDIRWFKTVELRTKYGRVGHISEPLGTHGYMKCIFDGNVTQQDTVCMHLYKRVFPVSWRPKVTIG